MELSTEATLANVLASGADAACLFFWAEFDPASKRGGQMDKVYSALLAKHPEVTCVKVDAEAMEDLADQYDVQSVPTFIFVSGGAVLGKVAGANPPALAAMFASVAAKAAPSASAAAMIPAAAAAAADADASSAQAALNARLRRLTSAARVMVFMKGSPQEPKCKFSRQIVAILQERNINFASFDILSDDAVRQGIKKYSDWPTFPQLYVGGTLVGGLDIVKEHVEDGELMNIVGQSSGATAPVPPAPPASAAGGGGSSSSSLTERLGALVKRAPVMLFMKGTRTEPQCGFSRKIVEILDAESFDYDTFDILSDQDVRQGLKTFSNWPTFPQLYVKGELIGGLDIVKEMAEDDELADIRP